jgi:transposase
MAMRRVKAVLLDDEHREMLMRISKSRTEEARRVERARILLMAADGNGDKKIAKEVGLNKNSIHNTVAKFHAMGIQAALSDLSRKGRPPRIDGEAKAWVISQACIKPQELGYAQELWTIQKLTEHIRSRCAAAGYENLIGVSSSNIWTILDENEIKPHRVRYYLERRDPDFEMKMKEVLMVYKEVEIELEGKEGSGGVTVSFDEKPGIQAIAVAFRLIMILCHDWNSEQFRVLSIP